MLGIWYTTTTTTTTSLDFLHPGAEAVFANRKREPRCVAAELHVHACGPLVDILALQEPVVQWGRRRR